MSSLCCIASVSYTTTYSIPTSCCVLASWLSLGCVQRPYCVNIQYLHPAFASFLLQSCTLLFCCFRCNFTPGRMVVSSTVFASTNASGLRLKDILVAEVNDLKATKRKQAVTSRQEATLEKIYSSGTSWPSNDMVQEMSKLTGVHRNAVKRWFEDRRKR